MYTSLRINRSQHAFGFLGTFKCLLFLSNVYLAVYKCILKRAPYVCVSVRPSVRAQNVKVCFFSVISRRILIPFVLSDRAWCGLQNFYTEFWNSLIMQIYANLFKINEKCYFSVISWPILILFVLSDRAWCGLQNFYTEFWNSLIMQIYTNLFKINEKCYSSIFWAILILFVLSDRAWWGLQNFYTEFWNSLIMQIYANLFKINEKCYFSSISQRILILFVLSDRAWWGLQNFYTEFWKYIIMQIYANLFKINEKCYFSISQRILIMFVLSDRAWWGLRNSTQNCEIHYLCQFMQIYSKSMKSATSPLFRNHNRSALPAGTFITHRVIYYPLVRFDFSINNQFVYLLNSSGCKFDIIFKPHGNILCPKTIKNFLSGFINHPRTLFCYFVILQ